jgi:hypothetical protein
MYMNFQFLHLIFEQKVQNNELEKTYHISSYYLQCISFLNVYFSLFFSFYA